MSDSVWSRFGLKGNPYDTSPLEEGTDLGVERAFVGREREVDIMEKVFMSFDGGRIAICGKPGVGKTTLANYVKFNWKYKRTDKVLFSSRTELEASSGTLNKRSFILEILSSVYREIKLRDPKLAERSEMLEIRSLIDLGRMKEMSGGFTAGVPVFQINASKTLSNGVSIPAEIPDSTLVAYFEKLIAFVKEHEIAGIKYSGIIVHMNNFDVVMDDPGNYDSVVRFFSEVRDVLQTKDVYFIFLGPQDFYNAIIDKNVRVSAIFSSPISLAPLSKTDLVTALNYRLAVLESRDVESFNPFYDDVVYKFYDMYQGDIRSILKALSDIAVTAGDITVETLNYQDALYYFAKEKLSKLKLELTDEQFRFLEQIMNKTGPVNQKDLAKEMNIAPNNVSSYYFKPLKECGIIHEVGRDGKIKHWDLTEHYIPLREYYKSVKKNAPEIEKKIKEGTKMIQQKLF